MSYGLRVTGYGLRATRYIKFSLLTFNCQLLIDQLQPIPENSCLVYRRIDLEKYELYKIMLYAVAPCTVAVKLPGR